MGRCSYDVNVWKVFVASGLPSNEFPIWAMIFSNMVIWIETKRPVLSYDIIKQSDSVTPFSWESYFIPRKKFDHFGDKAH